MSTVPRQLVHRQSIGEVFLTDYRLSDDAPDQVAVQLPTSHRIFRSISRMHDPLVVAEAFRQAVVLLCHTKYKVPAHYKFLMERFEFEIVDGIEVRCAPTALILDMVTTDVTSRNGHVSAADIAGVLRDGPRILARCNAVTRCANPTWYSQIRAGRDSYTADIRRRPSRSVIIPAACVGRAEEQDVSLCVDLPTEVTYCAPDPENYALFDHPLDHIPGMVLFDSALQAIRYRSNDPSIQLRGLSATFPAFTEWDAPCEATVSSVPPTGGTARFCVEFTQLGTLTAQVDCLTVTQRAA